MTSATASSTTHGQRTGLRSLGAAAFVLGAAAATGALTPFGEVHLPHAINAAANSSGPWATIAFASIAVSRARGAFAAVLGAGAFVLMDVFFYVVFDLRGGYYPHTYLAFWLLVAVVIGPLVGLSASWLRSERMLLREIGIAAPASVLIGEGIFMLERLPGVSTVYALASVVVGFALFGVLAAALLRRAHRILVSALVCAIATATFFSIYSLVPLVLNKTVP